MDKAKKKPASIGVLILTLFLVTAVMSGLLGLVNYVTKDRIAAFKADPLIRRTLGDHVYRQYLNGKETEWEEYRTRVSSWEVQKYIGNY